MVQKEFVPYEEALALKELGFNEPCLSIYDKDSVLQRSLLEYPIINSKNGFHEKWNIITAPLYQQAFRFFREKCGLKSWIQEHTADTFIYEIRPHKLTDYKEGEVYVYEVYEEAELACLKKLIEIQGGNK